MADNNADIELLATLDESSSEAEILKTIKILNDKLKKNANAKIKLDTNFDTKAVEQEIQRLHGLLQSKGGININVGGNVDSKGIIVSVKNVINQAKQVASKIPIPVNFDLKKEKLINDIKILGQQNSKLFTDSNMAAKYNSLLDTANLATSNKELKGLRLQLSALKSEIKATNLSGLSLGETFKKTFKRATELFAGTGGVMLLSQQLREAWREALNLDKAYTDLIKVQDELSRGDYPEYLEQCNKKAQELAATQQGLIEGVTEFSKSGYDLTTSNKLSEKSTILSNVGEMSASDSAKALISGIQAYDQVHGYTDVVDKAQALIDAYNEIGNTASITSAEIAQGVQAVGSVFEDANTSVDQFIALLAAGNRQFQNADSLALGLRTTALKIRGAKTELENIGEDTEGMITSVSELQEKVKALTDIDGIGGKDGVSILTADGNDFHSIYDILLDISKVYKDMSGVDQSALLNLITTKHRASGISAVLNNMSEAQEIYERSLNSAGSAQKEYDKYLESSEASLNKFRASMIETYQSVVSGETVTGLLDCGNAALQFANSLNLVESTLKGFVAIAAVKGITKFSVALKASTLQASNFGKALQFASNVPEGNLSQRFGMLKNIAIASKSLTEVQLKQVLSNKALSNEDRIRILRLNGMEKSLAQAKLAEYGLTQATNAQSTAQKAATINTFSFSAAIKGLSLNLKAAFMSNPIGISIMALSTVIGGVSAKVSEYKENVRETRQANIDAANSAKEEANTLQDLYIQYSTLNGITDKTSSQEEEFKRVVEDITKALGDKASALEGLTAGQEEYTKKLKEATKAELEGQYATAKIGAGSAKDALKEVAYSSWSGSKITVEKNERMTGIEEHVAALKEVEPILQKFEDIGANGIHWEPINWDKNSNDMNALLEYYYSLIEAREKLVTSDNADFLMTSDIYKDINTTINELSDSVETYTEQQYNALKLEYEWKNGIPQTKAEFDAMEASILSASGAGEEFQKILKEYLTEDFSGLVAGIQNVEETQEELLNETTANISTISSSVQQIATQLEPQFEKLGEAYKAIFTDDGFTLDDVDNPMLEGLRKSFAEIEEEVGVAFDATKLNSFFDALTNGNSTAEQVQQAFNDLATAYFYSTDTLAQLNEETADSIAKQLEELGIVNAKEVVYDTLNAKIEALALQEQFLAQTGIELANASNDKVIGFLNEAGASETAKAYLFQLITAEQVFNNQDLSVQEKIDKLKELANAYGQTAIAARIANLEKANENGHISIDYDKELASLQNDINNAVNNVKIDFSGVGGDASKAGKKAGDAYVEAYEKEVKKLDDLKSQGKITEKQYLDYLRKLYEKYFKKIGKYAEKFAEEQAKYLSGMKSLYESALSGITSMLDKQINSYQDQKEAAVDALEEQKEAAVDALESERDARIEVLEIQQKQIEEQIKSKQKIIDSIQEEIDAMREAIETRQKNLDLQKAQYELEKKQQQRTKLVYTNEKGMTYQTDTDGIREAKQNVEDKKLEIEIANKEKQISLIEKEIDLLEEQKDNIDEQIDKINDYYDKLIEQTEKSFDEMIKNTEKYWDELIKGLENYKSRWEELAELEENAKLMATLKELGIATEDVLGMSEEAFNKFKNEYVGILADIYSGNDTMTNALADSLGTTTDKLGSYITATQGYIDSLGGSADALQPVSDALNNTSEGMDALNTSASNASTSTSQVATNMGTLNTNTTGLSNNLDGINNSLNSVPDVSATVSGIAKSYEELGKSLSNGEDGTEIDAKLNDINTELTGIPADASTKIGSIATEYDKLDASIQNEDGTGLSDELVDINDALTNFPESSKFDAMATAFTNLGLAIKSVADALGVGEEGSVGGLIGALQEISSMSLDGASTGGANGGQGQGSGQGNTGGGIISQFNALKDAVDAVTSAIGGGGEGGSGGEGTGGEGESGGSGGLINAINEFKSATDEALGGGGESGEGGSGKGSQGGSSEGGSSGAIPQFEQLKTAVDDVTASIGTGEEEGGSGEGDTSTLTGAITALGEKTTEVVGSTDEGETINGRFQQMSDVLGEADAHVTGISDGLDAIDGKEVECTIKVNIETNGSTSFVGAGMVLGSMNLNSAEYKAQYGNAHYEGTAKVTGDWGVRKGGKTLVGEKGREIVVRGSHFFTVGDNGAEFVDLQPNDIVFNHIQTAELLKNGHISSRGKALANGTVNDGTIVTSNGTVFRPLQPGDKDYELFKKFQDYQEKFITQIIPPVNAIDRNTELITKSINNVNNRSTQQVINQNINLNCPNVTNNSGVEYIQKELGHLSQRAMQEAYKN